MTTALILLLAVVCLQIGAISYIAFEAFCSTIDRRRNPELYRRFAEVEKEYDLLIGGEHWTYTPRPKESR